MTFVILSVLFVLTGYVGYRWGKSDERHTQEKLRRQDQVQQSKGHE